MRTCRMRLLVLLLWLLSAASRVISTAVSCFEGGNPTACHPPYQPNFAAGILPEAGNTCGLAGPERVCYPLGSRGRVAGSCDFCDAENASLAHLPEHITDSEGADVTYWQSQTLTFLQYPSSVSVTVSFNRTLEIREIIATFHSSRPESYTILKSTDFGLTYVPFHYFSQSCNSTYGVAEGTMVEVGNEAVPLCTSEAAQLTPSSGGQAVFRPLMHRPSAANFESVPELQKWVMATDIRLRLDRLNTFGDELLTDNRKILDGYYYAISNLEVDARCACNGHASSCLPGPGGQVECVCEHNTAGPDCSECLPTHQAVPWAPATPNSPSVCRETPTPLPVFLGSLTFNASGVQGNVFALGQRTLMLTEFFYDGSAPAARFYVVRGPSVFSPVFWILLNEDGSAEPLRAYVNESLVLTLPAEITIDTIDWFSVWELSAMFSLGELEIPDDINITAAEPPVCDCDRRGTVGGSCRRNGTCTCKTNVEGDGCSQCQEGFFALSRNNPDGCSSCDCDPIGSVSAECDAVSGQCMCQAGFIGWRCDACAAGLGGLACEACGCDPIGSLENTCSRSGQCDCRPGVDGLSCDICLPGYFDFGPAGCRPCDCDPLGATSSQCDGLGKCVCREGVAGEKCDVCQAGYSNLSDNGCTPCNCEGAGVRVGECEPKDGSCLCLPGYLSNAQGSGCVPCPCPGVTPEGQFASSCDRGGPGGGVVCLDCQEGHGGDQCETCLGGYFGDPAGTITGTAFSCIQCDCNGNVDSTDPTPCDSLGCRNCLFNTAGRQCERCAPGYYGDAITSKNCTACSCISPGTAGPCDPQTGSCNCLPGVAGPDCRQCAPGYFNMTAGEGCQPCRCNPLGTVDPALQCDSMGVCECQEGATGEKCDGCLVGYYWSEKGGCLSCNCHPNGSVSEECDGVGVCQCQDIAIGSRCDVCQDGFHVITEGCISCPACYDQIATEFNETLVLYEELLSLVNTTIGGERSPELLRQIEGYEELLLELLQRLLNLTQREDDLRSDVDSAIMETSDLSELIGQFKTNVSTAENDTVGLTVLVSENLVLLEELRTLVEILEQTLRLQIRGELQTLQSLYSLLQDELNQLVNFSQLANETSFIQQALATRLLQESILALQRSTSALDLLCQTIVLQNETTAAIELLEEDRLPSLESLYAAARDVLSQAELEVPAVLNQARTVLERALAIVIPEYNVEPLRVKIEILANRTEEVYNATVITDSELDVLVREYELLRRNATRLLDESRELNVEAQDLLVRAHGALTFANDSVETITTLLNRVTALLDELRLRLADAGNFTAAVEELLRNVELAENLSAQAGQEAEQRAMEVRQAVQLAREAAGLLDEAGRDIQEALRVATQANALAITTLSNATALNSSVHDLASQVDSTQTTVDTLERQADIDSAAITDASSTASEAISAGSDIQVRIVELQANLSELSRELNTSSLLSPERLQAIDAKVNSLEAEDSENQRIVDGLQRQIEQLQASSAELRSRYVQLQQHRDLLEDILSNVQNLDCRNQFQRLSP